MGENTLITILMNENKQLLLTQYSPIYQGESNVNQIRFLLPQSIGELSDQITVLFLLPNSDLHIVELNKSEELYKEHFEYLYNIEETLLKDVGQIKLRLQINKNQENEDEESVVTQTLLSSFICLNVYEGIPSIQILNKEDING